MRRLRIIDDEPQYREHGFRSEAEHEAYKCGWRDAMRELERERESYHERHYPQHGGHILYREHDFREPYPDEIEYRRRRGNGRYY